MKGRGEDDVAAWLRRRLTRAELDASVELRLLPQREDARNPRPDFVIEGVVRVPLFEGRVLTLRLPLLVEVEAGAGFDNALVDLECFVERSLGGRQRPLVELPFTAVTERCEARERELVRLLPVRFRAIEVQAPRRGRW